MRGQATSLATYGEGSSALENLLAKPGRAGGGARPQRTSQVLVKDLGLSVKPPENHTRRVTYSRIFLETGWDMRNEKAEVGQLGGSCRRPECNMRTEVTS